MFSSMKRTFAGNIEITLNPSQPVTRMGADRLTNGSLDPRRWHSDQPRPSTLLDGADQDERHADAHQVDDDHPSA